MNHSFNVDQLSSLPPIQTVKGHKMSNSRRGKELTAVQRDEIQGRSATGQSVRKIASETGVSRSSVHITLKYSMARQNGQSLPRSG